MDVLTHSKVSQRVNMPAAKNRYHADHKVHMMKKGR